MRAARLRSQRSAVSCNDVDPSVIAQLSGSSRAPMYGSRRILLLHSCAAPSSPIDVDPPGRQVETLRVRIRSSLTAMRNHIQLCCHKCSKRYMRTECTPGSPQKPNSEVTTKSRDPEYVEFDDRHHFKELFITAYTKSKRLLLL